MNFIFTIKQALLPLLRQPLALAISGQAVFVLVLLAVSMLLIWIIVHFMNRGRRKRMQQLANYDMLTGLPNTAPLQAEMKKRGNCAVAVFDIKYFKAYNELMGYDVGDVILKGVADQLRAAQEKSGIYPARLQSASFAVLLPGQPPGPLRQAITELLAQLEKPGTKTQWNLRFACGVTYQKPGEDPKEALQTANFARLAAAGSEGTEIVFFDNETYHQLSRNITESGQIRTSTGLGKLVVAFQPKYSLHTGLLTGAEALIRWQHPQKGLLLPADFLPVLEQTGDIKNVDNYVLRHVLWQINEWRSHGLRPPTVSVNLSRIQFTNPGLAQELLAVTAEYGVSSQFVELELTESAFLHDEQLTLEIMRQLRTAGFRVSLDDFGTGASSINLLRQMPLDVLILDRSILENIETDQKQQLYVQDIVHLAHNLGISTLVKGVETEAQAHWAGALGSDLVQGFLYGRPMPAEDLAALVSPQADG